MATSRVCKAIQRSALVIPLLILVPGAAHAEKPKASQHDGQTQYFIVELPSLGGSDSAGAGINNLGMVAGYSNESGNETRHAVLWFLGLRLDLGTLGGPNSTVIWPGSNNGGMVVGFSETDELDPREEDWSCSFFFPGEPTHHVCRGFAWEWGEMKEMPTLGGTHSVAVGSNNRGQVVGWAETAFDDPTCEGTQVLQFLPAVWKPRTGQIRDLPPFGDDSVGTANAINNRGQIVGISGDCGIAVGGVSARHAVMWENGLAKDLGDIGGDAWNTPTSVNERGQVVGFANVTPGPAFNEHGFLWSEEEGMQDLGTLEGDVRSQAWGINEHGQVVGLSRGAGGDSAVLWQDGAIIDLNDFVAFDYDKHLLYANDINDLGIITGQAEDPDTEEGIAFLAIPIPASGPGGGD